MRGMNFETYQDEFETYQGRGPSQQLLAKYGMAFNDVQCDIDFSQQESDSHLVFSDSETNQQLFTKSGTVFSNAQCGSHLNSANEKLIFNSELGIEDESGQSTTTMRQIQTSKRLIRQRKRLF